MLCFHVKYDLCYIFNVRTALYLPHGPTGTDSWHSVRVQVNSVGLMSGGGDTVTTYEPQRHTVTTYESQRYTVTTYETQRYTVTTYEPQRHTMTTYEPQRHTMTTYEP